LLSSALGVGVFGIATASRDAGVENQYQVERIYDEHYDFDDRDSLEHDEAALEAVSYRGVALYTVYQEECGSCHLAYPPGLLPSASWKTIIEGLDDHFGENAALPADLNAQITMILDEQASDRGDHFRNARLLRDVTGNTPLRITELPYFKDKHDEIPRRMVEDNREVQSFGRCDACHQDAAKGRFDEDTVAIPGFGSWDD